MAEPELGGTVVSVPPSAHSRQAGPDSGSRRLADKPQQVLHQSRLAVHHRERT